MNFKAAIENGSTLLLMWTGLPGLDKMCNVAIYCNYAFIRLLKQYLRGYLLNHCSRTMAGPAGIEPTPLGSKPSILSIELRTDNRTKVWAYF